MWRLETLSLKSGGLIEDCFGEFKALGCKGLCLAGYF